MHIYDLKSRAREFQRKTGAQSRKSWREKMNQRVNSILLYEILKQKNKLEKLFM